MADGVLQVRVDLGSSLTSLNSLNESLMMTRTQIQAVTASGRRLTIPGIGNLSRLTRSLSGAFSTLSSSSETAAMTVAALTSAQSSASASTLGLRATQIELASTQQALITSTAALKACQTRLTETAGVSAVASTNLATMSGRLTRSRTAEKGAINNVTTCQNRLTTATRASTASTNAAAGSLGGVIGNLTRVTPLLASAAAGFGAVSVITELGTLEGATIELRLAAESAQEYGENLQFLRSLSAETGANLSDLVRTFGLVAFAADRSTESIEDIRTQFAGLGRTAAISNITGQSFRQLFITLERVTASGRITARELNVITARIPNFLRAAAVATRRQVGEVESLLTRGGLSGAQLNRILTDTAAELNRVIAPQFEGANRLISTSIRTLRASFLGLIDSLAGITEGATRGTGITVFFDGISRSLTALVPAAIEARRVMGDLISILSNLDGQGAVGRGLSAIFNNFARGAGLITSRIAEFITRSAELARMQAGINADLNTIQPFTPRPQADPPPRQLTLRERIPGVLSSSLFSQGRGGRGGGERTSGILDSLSTAITQFTAAIPGLARGTTEQSTVIMSTLGTIAGGFLRDAVEAPLQASARALVLGATGASSDDIREQLGTVGGTFAPVFDRLFGLSGESPEQAAATRTADNTASIDGTVTQLLRIAERTGLPFIRPGGAGSGQGISLAPEGSRLNDDIQGLFSPALPGSRLRQLNFAADAERFERDRGDRALTGIATRPRPRSPGLVRSIIEEGQSLLGETLGGDVGGVIAGGIVGGIVGGPGRTLATLGAAVGASSVAGAQTTPAGRAGVLDSISEILSTPAQAGESTAGAALLPGNVSSAAATAMVARVQTENTMMVSALSLNIENLANRSIRPLAQALAESVSGTRDLTDSLSTLALSEIGFGLASDLGGSLIDSLFGTIAGRVFRTGVDIAQRFFGNDSQTSTPIDPRTAGAGSPAFGATAGGGTSSVSSMANAASALVGSLIPPGAVGPSAESIVSTVRRQMARERRI